MVTLTQTFQRERFSKELAQEIFPLLESHWSEICTPKFKDKMVLNPDWDFYDTLEKIGKLRVYTARVNGKLIGYWCMILRNNPHYRDVVMAVGDVLFIHPDHRGMGKEFMPWVTGKLRDEGVDFVSCYVKAAHDFSPLLKKMGFDMIETVHLKRLS